ncbi:Maf-like protein [Stappia taiwanensis]|uniref:Nucleoside triphosphate pyrophosphatase n=1 Tax=Stappia taiwanensis TaxID=992267 RepID=A0A838Y162_9HYPH|nr:Maf-like protein [Stappia taiwanensis]MBA4612964.1 Maf-like protein [Stappia taiwanensis]GGF06457.1 Maf-like protein [Stappia taiwanensis]
MTELVLASGSQIRAELLQNAGLTFDIDPARVDERAIEAPLLESDFSPEDIAQVLAEAKAQEVSERRPGALVIGADQVLDFEGERLTKPADMEAARRQLLAMSGKTHALHSAVAIARDGQTLWRNVGTVRLTMRPFGPEFVGRYLAGVGEVALTSVGAYQLEGPGIQLFSAIDGDYFTVLGLPLLPLLGELRVLGALEG